LNRDDLERSLLMPTDTAWTREIRAMAEGTHPDPTAFLQSVARLTGVSWTLAQLLCEGFDALGELDAQTYGEYLWFFADPETA